MPFVGVTLLVVAAAVNGDLGVSAETRAGHAPIIAGRAAQNTAISAITPMAGAEASTHVVAVRLQYAPRLSWVFTHESDTSTYVLHQGALSLQWHPSQVSTWVARAAAETGETDYSALTQLLGKNQSAVPTVKGFTMFQGTLTGTQDLARTWRFEMTGEAIRRVPLVSTTKGATTSDVAPPPPPPGPTPTPTSATGQPVYVFPDQTSLSLTPALSHPITREDALVLRTGVSYGALSTGLRLLTLGPELGWRRTVGATSSLHADLGMVHAERLRVDNNPSNLYRTQTPPSATSPVGGVGAATQLYGERGIKVVGNYNAAVAWYLDPVLGASGAQGTTNLQVGVELPPAWSVGLETAFTTSLRSHPLPNAPDETLLVTSLPIRYRTKQNFFVEFGGRAAARAPHFESHNFAFHRPEFWAYLMLGTTFGTRRGG